MQLERTNLEWLELTAQLIDCNKQFTDALKAKRPHAELVLLYAQIQAHYHQIHALKKAGLPPT